jgi:hypothetical protein
VGVCLRCVGEGWAVGVDSGELAELLPRPVCVVVPEVLDIAVAVSDVETGFGLVSHYNA